jgi:hypothetical protein
MPWCSHDVIFLGDAQVASLGCRVVRHGSLNDSPFDVESLPFAFEIPDEF